MNFKRDLADIASKYLNKEGITIPSDWDDNTICINFFELTHRWFDSSVPYKVVYSKEILTKMTNLTTDEKTAIQDIEYRLKNCQSIISYMSRGIKEIDISKSDFLLKNWNIYHLHLEQLVPPVARYTKPNLLFFQPKGQVIHFIDVVPHPKASLWFNRSILDIIYNNWPHLLVYLDGVKPIQEIPDSQVHNLTKQIVTIIDFHGGSLLPTNFGVMGSGHSHMAVDKTMKIFNKLTNYQLELEKLEDDIKKEIFKATGASFSEKLDYKLIIEKGWFIAQEIHTLKKINLMKI